MNKFFLVYIIFVVIWFLNICYGLIETLRIKFWVSRGRCPKCLRAFWSYNDYGIEFGYCRNHPDEAYYEDGVKVIFRD